MFYFIIFYLFILAQVTIVNAGGTGETELFKTDNSFECLSECIRRPSCNYVIRRYPHRNDDINYDDCYLRNATGSSTTTPIEDYEYIGITDYSNEVTIENLPYGYLYRFRVGIYDATGLNTINSGLSATEIDFRISKTASVSLYMLLKIEI